MNEKHMQDKRRFKRAKTSFMVIFKMGYPVAVRMVTGEDDVDAIALDISEGGMGVLTNHNIAPSASVTIKFTMINDKATRYEDKYRSMEIYGEVRYCSYTEEKRAYRMGIRFVNISNSERQFIANFVKMAALLRQNDDAGK